MEFCPEFHNRDFTHNNKQFGRIKLSRKNTSIHTITYLMFILAKIFYMSTADVVSFFGPINKTVQLENQNIFALRLRTLTKALTCFNWSYYANLET